ncbi:hypothetical protein ACPV5G_01270 [Photobacterium damselae]|uniref:hypothetical protein n=1 Tax=Photobacterium damselae TaxID=38293 RepID=UPI00406916D0
MKLSQDRIFIGTLIIGVVMSMISAVSIYLSFDGSLVVCAKPACFDNLLNWFSFPLKVLTATVAVMGIVAMLHRSKQTAKQIELSTQQIQTTINQNMYLNYFSHLKDFKEQVSRLEFRVIEIEDRNKLYKALYPDNTPVKFSPVDDIIYFFNSINSKLKQVDDDIYSTINKLSSNTKDEILNPYCKGIRDIIIDLSDCKTVYFCLLNYKSKINDILNSMGIKPNWTYINKKNTIISDKDGISNYLFPLVNLDFEMKFIQNEYFDDLSRDIDVLLVFLSGLSLHNKNNYAQFHMKTTSYLLAINLNVHLMNKGLLNSIDTLNKTSEA